jgi:hypothetical protein
MASPRRLKVSSNNAQRIIDIVLSDERLVSYVTSLASKRLTPDVLTDEEWCNKVVDLTIDQVLNDVNVFELLKSLNNEPHKRKARSGRNGVHVDEEVDLIRPAFSSTEPKSHVSSSPRRVVKELNKRKPITIPGGTESGQQNLSPPRSYNRSTSAESEASTVAVVQPAHDGVIISHSGGTRRKTGDWVTKPFPHVRSESSISSNHDDLFESVIESEVNTSLRSDAPPDPAEESSPLGEHHADALNRIGARFDPTQTIRLPIVQPALQQSTDSSAAQAAADNEDFLAAWEQKVLQHMRDGDEEGSTDEGSGKMHFGGALSADDGEWHEVSAGLRHIAHSASSSAERHSANVSKAGTAADFQEFGTKEDGSEYSSDTAVDIDEEDGTDGRGDDYLSSAPQHSYSNTAGAQVLFFDQSRFDADADFFSAESDHSTSPLGKVRKSKGTGSKIGGTKRKGPVGDSPPRVRFAPQLISEVRYRDRVGYAEKAELFFTHNEEYQFTLDQGKEMERAEALGA